MNCDCSCDISYGESPSFVREEMPTARKTYKCCECREKIEPGQKYNKIVGVWGGDFKVWRTCQTCHAIAKEHCPGGYFFGELADAIYECLGFDYREAEVPANG